MSEPDDDDKTVIPGLARARQAPAAETPEPSDSHEINTLPIGTRLGEFEIKSIIGTGGFGIVYLAHDHSLGRDVALKEYLPTSLAYRNGLNVSVRTRRDVDTFSAGMTSFINEARVLAHFDNPSLVKVYRFWSANGTAYMVMPYYEGPTLKQTLQKASAPPNEAWLRALLSPLLSALQLLHSENYFHRDIAPDNILLVKGDRPILLDFGAARRVIAGSDTALTVILKPGYAPVEQYTESDMAQGAWTDIYALGAVMHYAITGRPPLASIGRMIKDTAIPLAQSAAGRYSDGFLRAIDRALSVRPEARPQSTEEFSALLGLQIRPADPVQRTSDGGIPPKRESGAGLGRKPIAIGAAVAVGVLAVAAVLLSSKGENAAVRNPRDVAQAQGGSDPSAAAAPAVPGSVLPAPPATGPAVAPAQSPSNSVPAAETTPALPPVQPRPFDPAEALAQVQSMGDAEFKVGVTLERTTVRVGKDKLRFRVESERPGYLYILMLGTDRQHISLLFPNALDQKNEFRRNQPINLPRAGWAMTAGGPPGTNEFVALVSEAPRDFRQLGLTKVGPFAELSMDRVAALVRSGAGNGAVLAGTPVCPSGGSPCSAAYGAARFQIEEIN